MSIFLSADLEQLIRAKVESGLYPTESDLIRAALRALDEVEKLDALRRDIRVGLDQIDRGEVAPLDMEAVRARVKARRSSPPVNG